MNKEIPLDNCDDFTSFKQRLKACQYIDLGRAMLAAMLTRQESRGSHYREDYPDFDEGFSTCRITVELENQDYSVKKVLKP